MFLTDPSLSTGVTHNRSFARGCFYSGRLAALYYPSRFFRLSPAAYTLELGFRSVLVRRLK